ncbi:MAG: DUF115 domain-containing protein, partial [Planctomycetes bacterium]|nr:DUF115 domain-containing protein [Planctomycetota bacterium]
MTPRELLETNAAALEISQPTLADGLRSVPDEMVGKLEALELPVADQTRLGEFVKNFEKLGNPDAVFLLGIGTPDMLWAVRDALPADCALVIIEPGVELTLRMLISADLSEFFETPYTALVTAPDDFELQRQVENVVAMWGLSEIQMVVNPMRPLGDDLIQLAVSMISNAVNNVQIAAANVAHFGNQIIDNVAANLPAAAESRDANALASVFAGKPAVIVGAGPSLDSDLATLKANADKAVVIAVDAAVKALSDAGVPIDLAVTLDVIGVKKGFLASVPEGTPVVSLLGAHPDLVESESTKRFFVSDEHPLSKWCAAILNLPVFPAMGNVAHLAYVMAKGAGCGKVCFVGVDYCLAENDKVYA